MPNNNNPSYCVATNQTNGYNWINFDCHTQTVASVICQLNPPQSLILITFHYCTYFHTIDFIF